MCDGYETPSGECLTPTFPILELPGDAVIVHPSPISELPNTGAGIDLLLIGAAIVLLGAVLVVLSNRRRPAASHRP